MSEDGDENMCCSRCSTYDSTQWEKNEDGEVLCDNCNENIIARNMVMELMQYEVKIDESSDREEEAEENKEEATKGTTVEAKYGVKRVKLELERVKVDSRALGLGSEGGSEASSEEEEAPGERLDPAPVPIGLRRRSVRVTLNRYKYPDYDPLCEEKAAVQPAATVFSRGRRSQVFTKDKVYRSPSATATTVTSDYLFYKGEYYQLGDIVAIDDSEGRGVFYAQITSLMRDPYMKAWATVQWLLPTRQSPPPNLTFDPTTYYLGFIDNEARPLDAMMPVMRAPSDYYRFNGTPYPPLSPPPLANHYVLKTFERIYINIER